MASLHRLGMSSAWGMTAAYLCSALALCGQLQEARANASRAQPLLRSLELEGLLFVHLAVLCARAGHLPEAARLVGCAQAWYAANHNAPDSTIERLFGLAQADVEAGLGGTEFERLRREGAAMPAAQAAALLQAAIGNTSER
jgi:hypothetical protein